VKKDSHDGKTFNLRHPFKLMLNFKGVSATKESYTCFFTNYSRGII